MICRIVINKMNKTKSSKLTHKSNHPMRMLFKMRANPYGAMRTLEDESRTQDLPNKSIAVPPTDERDQSFEHRYGNNRMRTEYSDRFGLFRRNNHSFHHYKRQQQQQQSPLQTVESQNKSVMSANKSYSRLSTAMLREQSIEKKTIQGKRQQEKLPEIREVPLTFEQIEDKIESIMSKRLNQCLQFKKKSDWVIDTEISKLIEAYKQIKCTKNPQYQQEDMNLLGRRIAILEKLIAESMTESQIVKKYYMGKVSNHQWKQHKTESFSCVEPLKTIDKQIKHQSLVNTSHNRDSYQQPQRQAYNIEKHGSYFFNPDRHKQPLPRSSYNRDFLTYGKVQSLSSCKPSENDCLKAASSAKIMNSSYRSNFVAKKAERINIKELDACKDKIKNLPVIFGKREKDLIAYNMAEYFRLKKQANIEHDRTRSIQKLEPVPNPHHFTSESKKEFIKAVQISPSQIKHKNLQRLKYSLKKQLHV